MHRAGSWSWFLFAVLLLVPSAALAQAADVLTGRITGPDGSPVAGARVEAISIETEITRSVLTGANGRYMILFPDGGGRYLLRVSFIGMATEVRLVTRDPGEELVLLDLTLNPQPIQLDELVVQASPPGEAGEQSTELTQELVSRLPLQDLDPATLALLAAGVIATADSLGGQLGFSVAGMSDLLNQITLDGVILGEGGLGVPEEGVRQTLVTTSTFDVSRGGFAGGQVAITTARGSNRHAGSLSYRLDDDALQLNSSAITNAFTRHHLGGSWGGPIIRDRLFFNTSFQLSRNLNHRFALAADDPLAAVRSGVNVDSISRFLSILDENYGIPTTGQTGRYNQLSDDIRLQGRIDWNLSQRGTQSHTLSARVNLNINSQDSTRINTMDLVQHGGETERNHRMGALTLNSRFGANWTNSFNISYGHSWSDALPYIEMPEGVVRVNSEFEDGTRGTRSMIFGGNRTMPSEAFSRDLQLSDDLSFLLPIGSGIHRLKVGATLHRSIDRQRSTDNLFGSYTYASLADFEANRPERYERALTVRETEMGRLDAGLYLGDTWRVSQPLEITLGLRWDYSRLDQRPAYNPAVEAAFGRRTDVRTAAAGFSPRVGFNYRLNQHGERPRSLSGGIGLFSGRAPTNIFSTAIRQTGLPDAEQRLICIGDAVPIPDWQLFLDDPGAVPELCADGGPGTPPALSIRAPNITLINPDQSLPSSLRVDLGYRTTLPLGLSGDFRYGYSRGIGLWGYRDVNLDEGRTFTLGGEGRPFFGDPEAIVPASGAVSLATSRRFTDFGNVLDVTSSLRSETHQLTTRLMGRISQKSMLNLNYTLGFSRDEATGIRGGNTAGNPNETVWGTSGNDRRHSMSLIFSHAFTPEVEFSIIGRASSGAPFTPIVNRDVNGDGLRNDRAFIFDPASTADPELAAAMTRLLETVPGRIRSCLESQFGTIADRNSCRNGWTQSLDLRASVRPNLPRLQRRMTISIDGRNALTALDQLFHGRSNLKGWGEGQRADANLLEVRGFDPVTRSFVYEINEGFGQTRRGPNAFRSPFSLTISARVMLGGQPIMTNRGFGAIAAGGAAPVVGGVPVAGGTRPTSEVGAALGPGAARGGMGISALGAEIIRQLREAGPNADLDSILDRALANPVVKILEFEESLALTPTQADALREIADALDGTIGQRRDSIRPLLQEVHSLTRASAGGMRAAGGPELMRRVQSELMPQLQALRQEIDGALDAARQRLTPEQWERLPDEITAARQESAPRGGAPGFNAVGLIDRMLANPIPVIRGLEETLDLTPEQISRIDSVSTTLQAVLNQKREDLGKRFDGVDPDRQARLFSELQPELAATRQEVTAALEKVRQILTDEQWNKVPERVRNPFQPTRGQGRGQR